MFAGLIGLTLVFRGFVLVVWLLLFCGVGLDDYVGLLGACGCGCLRSWLLCCF